MAKSLLKTVSKQAKKQNLHPRGRKTKQIARAAIREDRVATKKFHHALAKTYETQFLQFLQENVSNTIEAEVDDPTDDIPTFSISDVQDLLETWISRNDDEIESLKEQRRPGRPKSKKLEQLEEVKAKEVHQFETGWKVPDLRHKQTCVFMKSWAGDHGKLTAMKHIILKKSDKDDEDIQMEA